MRRKYLSLASLVFISILSAALLSGCGSRSINESANQGRVDEEPSAESGMEAEPPAAAEMAPAIADEELDQEIKALDADLEAIKTTGFEQADLSDKDLGL